MARIGFIGLGNMGGAMSANLVKAGHAVAGFDIVPERLARAAGRGVAPAASNAGAARGADFVFTMLPTGREVAHVLVTGDRVLDAVAPECIVVDSSTTDLTTTALIQGASPRPSSRAGRRVSKLLTTASRSPRRCHRSRTTGTSG